LNAHPQSIVARLNLARALLQLKQYERAAKENLAVLASHPNETIAHAQAGIALLHIGRFNEAISHLERAKQLDPSAAPPPGYVLATLYDDLGRDGHAIAEFANFLKDNPRYSGRSDVEYRIDQLCERHAGKGDAPVICASRTRLRGRLRAV
jgi:tetratricopeptide (TPR) repeat protein